jgi:hypothetical protein
MIAKNERKSSWLRMTEELPKISNIIIIDSLQIKWQFSDRERKATLYLQRN